MLACWFCPAIILGNSSLLPSHTSRFVLPVLTGQIKASMLVFVQLLCYAISLLLPSHTSRFSYLSLLDKLNWDFSPIHNVTQFLYGLFLQCYTIGLYIVAFINIILDSWLCNKVCRQVVVILSLPPAMGGVQNNSLQWPQPWSFWMGYRIVPPSFPGVKVCPLPLLWCF